MNPSSMKPPYKFATIPHGSTDTNIKTNYPHMYAYMQPYNKSTVGEGVRAVKDGYVRLYKNFEVKGNDDSGLFTAI